MNKNMEDIFSLLGAVRGCEDDLVGHVKQTSFKCGFFIEDIDFRFRHSSVRRHFTPAKFVEILCLDSIGAIYREYEGIEIPIETGVGVNRGEDASGELVFLTDIGYKHPGHFAAIFRNTYGVTPSEYVKLKKRKYTPMRGRYDNVAQCQENSL
jgi:hypothetical protein